MIAKLNVWLSGLRLGDLEDNRAITGSTLAALFFMVAVAVDDFWAGQQISLWVLYIVPIAAISWYRGPKYGSAAAGLAVILLCIVGEWAGHPYSNGLYFGIATFSQGVAFLLIVILVTSQRRLFRKSSTLTRFLDSIRTEDRGAKEAQARNPVMSGMWDIHPAIALLRGLQEMIRSGGRYEGKDLDVASFMDAARAKDVQRIYGGFPLTMEYLEKIARDSGFKIVVTENQISLRSSHLGASPGATDS